jgi:hypothetical protein
MRAISLNEMSMGVVRENRVADALGIGILCMDYSHCDIYENTVVGTRADRSAQVNSSAGYAIVSHYYSVADVERNVLERNAREIGSFANGVVHVP